MNNVEKMCKNMCKTMRKICVKNRILVEQIASFFSWLLKSIILHRFLHEFSRMFYTSFLAIFNLLSGWFYTFSTYPITTITNNLEMGLKMNYNKIRRSYGD